MTKTDRRAVVDEFIEAIAEEQHIPLEEAAKTYMKNSEHVFDPSKATPIQHFWVDRGAVLSCEGANHPNHHSWKRTR